MTLLEVQTCGVTCSKQKLSPYGEKGEPSLWTSIHPYQSMKLPNETNWVEALEKYPIGKVITLDKVKFEISSGCVFLPTDAFIGEKNIQEENEFYIEVYFRLEGSKANPDFITIQL